MLIAYWYRPFRRTVSNLPAIFLTRNVSSFFPLKTRELISIRGRATLDFLQGLMTNDARRLECKSSIIFSLFLNVKGRVVCDSLIYNIDNRDSEEPHFIIECDSECKPNLLKLLRFYNIRKKVSISDEPSFKALTSLKPSEEDLNFNRALFVGKDPRPIPGWSWRMLGPSDAVTQPVNSATNNEKLYQRVRYCLGLPEGAAEFRANDGLPLEANADICYGVSFNKGCYVGQELTARSRFVGVIRKRIAPIVFDLPVDPGSVPIESPIYRISSSSSSVVGNRPVGWVRGIEDPLTGSTKQQVGLALLRMAECAEAISMGDHLWIDASGAETPVSAESVIECPSNRIVHPFVPFWWEDSIAVGIPRMDNPLCE
nr:protein FAM76A [Hymenolepis microstoma]